MKKILVIEDEKRIADILQKGLEEFGYATQVAYDGDLGVRLAYSDTFDLVITDVLLPSMSGFDVCKNIRKRYPHIPILMLTALGTTDDKLEGFDSGADDYMVKPFDIRELHARISILLRRHGVAKEEGEQVNELSYADLSIKLDSKLAVRANKEIKLTPKEFNLLKYMIENAERVLSRTEIAEKVWNTHFDTGTNFIDVYINYLRKKIDRDFDQKLIQTRPGMGFTLAKE